MARAHGSDSLDSTKLHRANILSFLYVLLSTIMVLLPMLTNTKNCTQVSWKNEETIGHTGHISYDPRCMFECEDLFACFLLETTVQQLPK